MKLDKFWTSFVWFWLGLATIGLIKAHIRSVTVVDDLTRNHVDFIHWEPYVWEYSSTLVMLFLVFAVAYWVKKHPLFTRLWVTSALWHLLGSLVFSWLHVVLMVMIRKVTYNLLNSQYEFGNWATEWWYEYRKDVITYFTLLLLVELYYYLKTNFKTSTNLSAEIPQKKLKIKTPNGLFLLAPDEILTVESGGNYVYIHDTKDRVLLHRKTMSEIQNQLNSVDFLRVHRSYIVNLKMIKGLKNQGQDPCTLVLKNDKQVPVSRKYRKDVLSLMGL